jgi:1-acyl-sn-glycerol-3-phosphate acyltransferase
MLLFVVIMLVIFPFVIIASFFGDPLSGNMIFRLCRIWADVWFLLVFIRIKIAYESPHDKSKPYIFVSNHISLLDAAVVAVAYRQPLRALGKVEMSKIPVFGFIYKRAIVTVDRNSADNRAESVRLLKVVISKGISVLFFPEGTFNMTGQPLKDFYDGAFRVAIETQTPLKLVLFLDTAARMNNINVFSLNPGRCRIVYLDEVSVIGMTAADIPILKEKVFNTMKQKLIEYKVSWILPTIDKG